MPSPSVVKRARVPQNAQDAVADLANMPLRDRKKVHQRASLIQVALKLFRDQGFESTRMEDIAQHAQVSTPTVYNYFTSKRDVLVEALKQDRSDSKHLFEKIVDNPPSEPEEALAALIHANMSNIRRPEDKRLWREILSAVARSHDREQDPFEANHEVFKNYIERLLKHFVEKGKLIRELPIEVAVDVIFAINSQDLRHIASSEQCSPGKIKEMARGQMEFVLAKWRVTRSTASRGSKSPRSR
jgi:AcrR family transcriptional regulator